jgi:hypothetical protein
MHLQFKASPDDTADNIRRVVNALARHGINIEAIAPDFDPPHVRVLVQHGEPYDPTNASDPFNRALAAMEEEGLTPEIKSGLLVSMPNKPRVLKTTLDRLTREGFDVESILILPGESSAGIARVSFGVARTTIAGWDEEAGALQSRIEAELGGLPDG